MKKTILTIALLFLISGIGRGQVSLNDASKITIDFTTTVNGVNEGTFAGTGFSPTPATGQLSSNAWAVTGLSDGDLNFVETNTSGDYARGRSTGGVTTGGLYAFEVGTSNYALGFQATGSDFAPGTITLKITNNTGKAVTDLAIAYNIWEYNDQGRSSSLNFSHSADNSTYTDISGLDYTTTQAADASPVWASTSKSTTISGLNIADGVSYYIRWSSDDVGGSGSRDEIAIDDIEITPTLGAANPATKLAITSISPSVPSVGTPFDVTVQAQDAGGLPANVSGAVNITLTRGGGTGALGGTLTGTIADGTNEVILSGVTYNTAESGVAISVADDASNLTAGTSAAFEVLPAANQLVFEQMPNSGYKDSPIANFIVKAQRSGDNSTDLNYTKDITISKASGTGTGTMSGTLTKAAVAGVATFDDITFDTDGSYTIQATDGSLTSNYSSSIEITTFYELYLLENFANANLTSSYTDGRFEGNNRITWTYIASRDQNNDANNSGIDGNAIMLRRVGDNSKITSSTVPGGIGNFSVKLYKGFTRGGDRQVELFVNGISQGKSTPFDDYNEHIFEINGLNISGDIVIEIRNITANQVIVDDIYWTSIDDRYKLSIYGTEGWRMLSSPTSDTYGDLLGPLWTQGITGSDSPTNGTANVQTYDGSGFSAISDMNTTMTPGEGFITYIYSDDNYDGTPDGFPKTLSLSGTENTGTVTPTLNSGDSAWTLVGNPYYATIDWDDLTKTDITGTVYVYDHSYGTPTGDDVAASESAGSYRVWNGTAGSLAGGKIAAFQGFWVQNASGGTPSLTIEEADKSSGGTPFYKETNRQSISIKLKGEMDYRQSETFLSFTDNGMENKDNFDGLKLAPLDFKDYLSVATLTEGTLLDINNLPLEFDRELKVPISVQAFYADAVSGAWKQDGGTVMLSWPVMENIPDDWSLTLHDYSTGTSVNMKVTDSYTFSLQAETTAQKAMPSTTILRPQPPTVEQSRRKGDAPRFTLVITRGKTSSTQPNEQPEQFSLEQNYPNPFNPSTRIQYSVKESGPVTLTVYNVMGQQVETLVSKAQSAGTYRVSWDAANMASGIYYYRLQAGNQILTRQMTLIK